MGYGFDWVWSGLGLVFMGLGWAGLRILEPMANTGLDGLCLVRGRCISVVGSIGFRSDIAISDEKFSYVLWFH